MGKIEVTAMTPTRFGKYLKTEKSGLLGSRTSGILRKFSVDREGPMCRRFGPAVKPGKLKSEIESASFRLAVWPGRFCAGQDHVDCSGYVRAIRSVNHKSGE